MILLERLCYALGGALADVFYFGVRPAASITAIGCVRKYSSTALKKFVKLAANVALTDKTQEGISENLFKCLDYID